MVQNRHATVRDTTAGRRIGVVGDVYRFVATGEETNGSYAAFEAFVPPGGGPPPHTHSREEESFLVLEGEMTFQVGDDRFTVGEGTFLNMPVGSVHCFKNEGDKPARLLITVIPAGLEEMFFEVGKSVEANATVTAPPSPDEIERLLAAAPKYGVKILIEPH